MTAEIMLTTPGLVNPVLSTDQSVYIHNALIALLNTPEGDLSGDPEQEKLDRAALSELVYFFSQVVDHPEAFGVRSALETKRLLRRIKPNTGASETASRRKKRQNGRGQRKKNSRATREEAERYNEAVRKVEADKAEMEQAHNDEMKKRIDRSNELLVKDTITNEELQDLLGIMGYENVAEAARIMRAENSTERRIERALQKSRAEGAED